MTHCYLAYDIINVHEIFPWSLMTQIRESYKTLNVTAAIDLWLNQGNNMGLKFSHATNIIVESTIKDSIYSHLHRDKNCNIIAKTTYIT